jgi:hypothetical protein
MKTNMTIKETLAWIVLAGAVFLFSATIAFAQEKKAEKKNTTTIKIVKKEDGKTTKIDTTFDSGDEEAVQKLLKDMGIEHDMNFNFSVPEPPDAPGDKDRVMKFHYKGMSKEDKEKLKEEMQNLKKEMGDLHEKLKDIHIEIFSDKDGDDENGYSYNFSMPPMPPVPPMNDEDLVFSDKDCKGKMRHHSFMFHNLDSLTDADHVAIVGDEDEQPPVFEKEVTGKHGEKIFVYKRSNPGNKMSKEKPADKSGISLFPNPNDGKFSLKFHSDKKSDVSVKVYDAQGKEVYSETMNDFKGDYSNQLDLSSKGKGNYILKITQDNKTMTERFVIE